MRLKHNEFRDLVNELRDTAERYGGTDQLRDQLSHTLARRVRPVPEIVEMRPVLERIDARLACDVLSASSTVEVLKLARDEIAVLAEEVRGLRAALQHEADCVEAAKAEVEVLRANVERMEKQEPVGVVQWIKGWPVVNANDGVLLEPNKPLYALPGAQPAPSVPEGWLSVPERLVDMFCGAADNLGDMPISEAWAERWSNEASDLLEKHNYFSEHAAPKPEGWKLVPVEPTPDMLTAAILSSHAINVHRAEHCYRAMIGAAPKPEGE